MWDDIFTLRLLKYYKISPLSTSLFQWCIKNSKFYLLWSLSHKVIYILAIKKMVNTSISSKGNGRKFILLLPAGHLLDNWSSAALLMITSTKWERMIHKFRKKIWSMVISSAIRINNTLECVHQSSHLFHDISLPVSEWGYDFLCFLLQHCDNFCSPLTSISWNSLQIPLEKSILLVNWIKIGHNSGIFPLQWIYQWQILFVQHMWETKMKKQSCTLIHG